MKIKIDIESDSDNSCLNDSYLIVQNTTDHKQLFLKLSYPDREISVNYDEISEVIKMLDRLKARNNV